MAIRVNLAAGGVVGVTGLHAGRIGIANNNTTIAQDGVYAAGHGETAAFTINLPTPGTDENFVGRVIIFKNFLPTGTELTIGRETRGGTQADIDGSASDYILDEQFQVISFYYIDNTIGWLAGPATL